MKEILAKLNSKYSNSEITRLANAGDWTAAQNAAAGIAWGLWAEIGEAAGLPCDETARQQWLDAAAARRTARFAKK